MSFCPRRALNKVTRWDRSFSVPPFILSVITSLSSDFTLGYLDDLTLAGPQSVVAADIQQVMAEGSKIGLCLNPSKCEVISHPD